MTQKKEEKDGPSTPVQIRVLNDDLTRWNQFAQEQGVTRSRLIKYATNLVVTRPELWENPRIGTEKLLEDAKQLEQLKEELKDLIFSQNEIIDTLKTELIQISYAEQFREEHRVKQLLKEETYLLLNQGQEMTFEDISTELQKSLDPQYHQFLRRGPEKLFCTLDDALTELMQEKLVKHNPRTNLYSSLSL